MKEEVEKFFHNLNKFYTNATSIFLLLNSQYYVVTVPLKSVQALLFTYIS